ncbi:hypothetical protein A1351_20285 [Methylosinus sp. R-45379]|uniref:hypothetical protein n=1 Tax=Methylosinus sp. R-45379 TaxID=980563 RepID=UPI0007C98D30|nr:hypothetical protein [Methylosinus sp. R-45379]OAI22909.1 hypothetical protein A1351_20285 [Methylosinus sp. R-45379]
MLPIVVSDPTSQPIVDAQRSVIVDLDDVLWRDLREARVARNRSNIHDLRFHLTRLIALRPPRNLPPRARMKIAARRDKAILELGGDFLTLSNAATPRAQEV